MPVPDPVLSRLDAILMRVGELRRDAAMLPMRGGRDHLRQSLFIIERDAEEGKAALLARPPTANVVSVADGESGAGQAASGTK